MKSNKYISVWLDKTNQDTHFPLWVVSLEDGNWSETLSTAKHREFAEETARTFARKLKLLIRYE